MVTNVNFMILWNQQRWEVNEMSATEYLSDCCGAPPKYGIERQAGVCIGICSQCKEWADFEQEPQPDEDDTDDEY